MSVAAKTESEASSQTGQSSPSRAAYYVQSPSRESSRGEKTTNSTQSTPVLSPVGSPLHSQSNSRDSSSTRFSHSARKQRGAWKDRFNPIEEEGLLDDDGVPISGDPRRCYFAVFLMGFFSLFFLFSLILWASSRPYRPRILMKSILFEEFVVQAGSDFSGVATEMVSMNATVKLRFRNTATFFGVHVTSTPLDLSYSQLTLATGSMEEFYESRKSEREMRVGVRGRNVPLYGGGASLSSSEGSPVPLRLEFTVRSRARILGELVKPKFYSTIRCSVTMHPNRMSTPIHLANKCTNLLYS